MKNVKVVVGKDSSSKVIHDIAVKEAKKRNCADITTPSGVQFSVPDYYEYGIDTIFSIDNSIRELEEYVSTLTEHGDFPYTCNNINFKIIFVG